MTQLDIKVKVNAMTVGITQALVLVAFLFGLFFVMGSLSTVLGGMNMYIGRIISMVTTVLLFFIPAVLMCAYPLALLVEGKKKEALLNVVWTIAALIVIMLLIGVAGKYFLPAEVMPQIEGFN